MRSQSGADRRTGTGRAAAAESGPAESSYGPGKAPATRSPCRKQTAATEAQAACFHSGGSARPQATTKPLARPGGASQAETSSASGSAACQGGRRPPGPTPPLAGRSASVAYQRASAHGAVDFAGLPTGFRRFAANSAAAGPGHAHRTGGFGRGAPRSAPARPGRVRRRRSPRTGKAARGARASQDRRRKAGRTAPAQRGTARRKAGTAPGGGQPGFRRHGAFVVGRPPA